METDRQRQPEIMTLRPTVKPATKSYRLSSENTKTARTAKRAPRIQRSSAACLTNRAAPPKLRTASSQWTRTSTMRDSPWCKGRENRKRPIPCRQAQATSPMDGHVANHPPARPKGKASRRRRRNAAARLTPHGGTDKTPKER